MTESAMEAMALQEDRDHEPRLMPDARDAIEFKARKVPYSSVVGSSIMLTAGDAGPVIGQLALLCFGDDQRYWADRITRALNNGAKAEKAIAHFFARGMIKSSREMPEGQGGPPRASKAPVDVREFVKSLDRMPGGEDHGAAIRREQKTPNQ